METNVASRMSPATDVIASRAATPSAPITTQSLKHAMDMLLNVGPLRGAQGDEPEVLRCFTGAAALRDFFFQKASETTSTPATPPTADSPFAGLKRWVREESVRELASNAGVKSAVMDCRQVSALEMQRRYDCWATDVLQRYEAPINRWLPSASEGAYGLLVGYVAGRLGRAVLKRRFSLVVLGVAAYSGLCYLDGQQLVKASAVQQNVWNACQQRLDVDQDGVVTNADIWKYGATKVEQFAAATGVHPGVVGTVCLCGGFLRGLGVIALF